MISNPISIPNVGKVFPFLNYFENSPKFRWVNQFEAKTKIKQKNEKNWNECGWILVCFFVVVVVIANGLVCSYCSVRSFPVHFPAHSLLFNLWIFLCCEYDEISSHNLHTRRFTEPVRNGTVTNGMKLKKLVALVHIKIDVADQRIFSMARLLHTVVRSCNSVCTQLCDGRFFSPLILDISRDSQRL